MRNGKYGYINKSGKMVIAPRFGWTNRFSEGLAAVQGEDFKYGYLDRTGKLVIDLRFDFAERFSGGLAR